MRHVRLAIVLGAAGALATALVFPYVLALMPGIAATAAGTRFGLGTLVAAQLAQAFVLLSLLGWVGLRLGASMGLDAPILRAWVYGGRPQPSRRYTIALACGIGLATSMAIVFLDDAMRPWMPVAIAGLPPRIAAWKGLLASFYGGIAEEVQLRLFLMTVLLWVAWKTLARVRPFPPASAAWLAIVAAAVLFGAAHLPAAARVWPLDAVVIARTLVLNTVAGIPFGWLFYRHGLEHAMAAHFTADIVLHVAVA